jgi:hypothetical protein
MPDCSYDLDPVREICKKSKALSSEGGKNLPYLRYLKVNLCVRDIDTFETTDRRISETCNNDDFELGAESHNAPLVREGWRKLLSLDIRTDWQGVMAGGALSNSVLRDDLWTHVINYLSSHDTVSYFPARESIPRIRNTGICDSEKCQAKRPDITLYELLNIFQDAVFKAHTTQTTEPKRSLNNLFERKNNPAPQQNWPELSDINFSEIVERYYTTDNATKTELAEYDGIRSPKSTNSLDSRLFRLMRPN